MVDLDELKRLAEGASRDWSGPSYLAEYEMDSNDAAFVEAMSPDTAKKLIAVALAAQAYVNDELDFAPNDGKRWAALRKALEELK